MTDIANQKHRLLTRGSPHDRQDACDMLDALAKERDELAADIARLKNENARLGELKIEAEDDELKAQAEVERLRKALRDIYNSGQTDEPDHWRFRVLARDTARSALQSKEGNE